MSETIGVDIGGTKMLGLTLDASGNVVREVRRASPHAGLDALVETAASIVVDLDAADCAVGVGAAGLVDVHGHLGYAPNLPLIRDAPLRDALEQATGRVVVLDNDANAAAIGERSYGAARDADHVLFVTLGTGIGGGMLLDGRIYRGAHHLGGEIGHFTVERDGPLCACGERGHWEAIASGNALGRMAREMVARRGGGAIVAAAGGDAGAVTGEHVGAAAAAGDDDAKEVLVQYAENVALGLAGLANILDPERIVIAGGIVELGALLFGPLREAFGRHLEGVDYRPAIELVPAALGERAGAVGAAVLAREGET
jgi:glucokinase